MTLVSGAGEILAPKDLLDGNYEDLPRVSDGAQHEREGVTHKEGEELDAIPTITTTEAKQVGAGALWAHPDHAVQSLPFNEAVYTD